MNHSTAPATDTNKPQSRLPGVGLSIFAVMSQKAAAHGALNLSQGFPDFEPPPALRQRVTEHLESGHNQYAPMPGLPRLREAVAAKTQCVYGVEVDPETEITVTTGATEALFAAFQSLVHPGDEVILFDPAYDAYDPAVRLAGGTPVHIPLQPPDYTVDWQRVRDMVGERTRVIAINSPHNPAGSLLSREDLGELEAIVERTGAWVVSDEVYEHIVFDGEQHISALELPGLRQRSLVISSFGKTYHATGWKVGYCIAPPALSWELRKLHQFITFCVNTPVQHAYADFLEHEHHYRELGAVYQQKRDHFSRVLADSRFRVLPCRGTYFQLLDYSAISDEDDTAFVERLLREHGVAAIPVSAFYAGGTDHRVLRMCFAKDEATLEQAGERLCAI